MQRRDLLKGGITAVAASFLPVSASADGKRQVTWAPYQDLDLDPQDMVKDEDIARIIWYAKEFIPQTCTGGPAYDPQNPNKPGTERRLEGYGKRIYGSEMSISVPNTYTKAVEIKKGLARLLAADTDHAVRDRLTVGLQFHTTGFDHPTDGITVPPGFNWGWVMTVPHRVADGHRRAWIDARYKWSATPSVQLAAEKVGSRGWPTGWLREPDSQDGAAVHDDARPSHPRVPDVIPRPLRDDQRRVGAGECRLGRQVRVAARQRRCEEPARDAQWCRSVAAEPLPR